VEKIFRVLVFSLLESSVLRVDEERRIKAEEEKKCR
jgi:hypothetical protein